MLPIARTALRALLRSDHAAFYVCICCREAVPNARGIELAIFDLADLNSVREWGKRAQDFGLPLDVLVNNAGKGAGPCLNLQRLQYIRGRVPPALICPVLPCLTLPCPACCRRDGLPPDADQGWLRVPAGGVPPGALPAHLHAAAAAEVRGRGLGQCMVGLALLPVSAANTPSLAVCLDPLCLASSQTPSPFPSFRDACTHAPTFDCCSNPDRPSRIINVSSAAHYFGSIDFSDLQSSKNYQPWKAYGQAKLANVLHTFELARQLEPTANCTGMATPLGTTLPCPPVGVQSDQPPSAHRFSP